MSENNLNEAVEVQVEDSTVITINVDDTLTVSGDAADAKAVGDALALKADKSELSSAIKVDGQSADAQGEIVLLANHIPMDASASPTYVSGEIAGLKAKTGADIPIDGTVGAKTIKQTLDDVAAGAVVTGNVAEMAGSITDGSTHVEGLKVNGETLPIRDNRAVRSVNGQQIDGNGNVLITNVETANNLVADDAQENIGQFIIRTAGGSTSIADGPAWLARMTGHLDHTGVVEEVLDMTVNAAQREEGVEPITATLDEDTFKAAITSSQTITLTYTTTWSANPELIGVTVTGTPINGDEIVIEYVKASRGTITPATPTSLRATGWNLYSHSAGYARVVKYSDEYGFKVEGTYTGLAFSTTLTGERTTITPVAGHFNITADGYVWVTGGNSTDTCIYMTWSDWTDGYDGSFQAYTEYVIDLTTLMSTYFVDGLLAVGAVADEIDLSLQKATVRVEKLSYSEETIEALEQAGRAYEADENYIYAVLVTPEVYTLQIANQYTVSDHGLELITGTDAPVNTITLYGQNLRDKLRTDVVTISQQQLTSTQQAQVRTNINALGPGDVVNNLSNGETKPVSSGAVYDAVSSDYTSFASGNMQVARFGRVVYLKIGAGSYTANADTAFATVPAGYRPALDADFLDSYSKKRIQVKEDGSIVCTEALSSTIIRGTVCYLAATT